MHELFDKIWHLQKLQEKINLTETSGLNIVERCPSSPENYCWQEEAWFNGRPHPIQRLSAPVWIPKKDGLEGYYSYQIVNFGFQDKTARKAQGSHFYIPEGKASNTILFTDRHYKWRARAVSGAGWIQAWHPKYGFQKAWIASDVKNNPVIEFRKNWIICLIAAQGYGEFVVEGVDIPTYKESVETIIPEGQSEITLAYKARKQTFDIRGLWKHRGPLESQLQLNMR